MFSSMTFEMDKNPKDTAITSGLPAKGQHFLFCSTKLIQMKDITPLMRVLIKK